MPNSRPSAPYSIASAPPLQQPTAVAAATTPAQCPSARAGRRRPDFAPNQPAASRQTSRGGAPRPPAPARRARARPRRRRRVMNMESILARGHLRSSGAFARRTSVPPASARSRSAATAANRQWRLAAQGESTSARVNQRASSSSSPATGASARPRRRSRASASRGTATAAGRGSGCAALRTPLSSAHLAHDGLLQRFAWFDETGERGIAVFRPMAWRPSSRRSPSVMATITRRIGARMVFGAATRAAPEPAGAHEGVLAAAGAAM